MAIAHVNHLTYWYPNRQGPALEDINLTIGEGITVVAGPSGSGKSTLLRLLNGLVPHFHGGRIAGMAEVSGMNIIDTPTRQLARRVGFVFQDPELQAVYDTVEHEVAFGLENMGVPAREMLVRIEEALHDAGAHHLIGRRIRTLSGGERQRVALASALAMRPQLVVLDEPTSQLDPEGSSLVLEAAIKVTERGRAVVISEHRLEHLMPAAQALVQVDQGKAANSDPRTWLAPARDSAPDRKSPTGAEAWSLSGVTAGFADHVVLDRVDLAGHQCEVVAISGPNGSGKTTLLRVIAGTLKALSGRVERRPGRIAYLPQNPTSLLHRPTVRSEVELTLGRTTESEDPDQILNALGLTAVAHQYPRDLSCGERQRAALAAVLPGHPDLVLLDEPTRGMDKAARTALIGLVASLRDAGSAIVLATHDAQLRDALADRVLQLTGGKAVEHSQLQAVRP